MSAEPLEPRLALAAAMVADANVQAMGAQPSDLVVAGNVLYFVADDGEHGRKLWKSDGRAEGTVLLKDTHPAPGSFNDPRHLINVNGTLFFVANDGHHGEELWKSDGTAEGTVLVKDIHQVQVGSTWGDYVQTLSDNATYLYQLGVRDVNLQDLYAFELQQANGLNPVGTLASAVDAFLPPPGLPFVFDRSFGNTVNERYQVGPFGRGWTAPWQLTLIELEDGTVIVHEASGGQRHFYPDSRRLGRYLNESNDAAVLRPVTTPEGSRFELTEANGMVVIFHPDGLWNYVQDTSGNRVAAGYENGQLTSLTHGSGASLTLNYYHAAGRIRSITDSTGRTTTYSYDPTGQYLLSVTGPGGTTSYSYRMGRG